MAFVQASSNNNGAGATTVVVTLAGGTTAGNSLVAMFGPRSTRTIASVSDNINGTTGWVIPSLSNPDGQTTAIPSGAYHLNPGAGVTTITITLNTSGVVGACVAEESLLGSFVGGILGNNGSGAVTSWDSHTVSCPAAAIGYGWSSAGGGGITYTQGSGWTALTGTNLTGGSNTNLTDSDTVFFERQAFGSSGSYSATGTNTPTVSQNTGAMFFNVASAGGTSDQALLLLI